MFSVSCNQMSMQQENTDQDEEIEVLKEQVNDGVFIHITEAYDDPYRIITLDY